MIAPTVPTRGRRAFSAGGLAFSAFLAALLGYGGALAYTMLSNFDVVNLHRDTFIDDAFYYFEIAKNLATGKFSTFDGGITRTNGYHPVWLMLVTPFYWIFDLESALFGIKALEIMLIAGGVCLLAVAVRLAQLPWFLLFAVLPALYGQRGMLVGMEAAAGAFFLGALLLAAVLFVRDAERWRWLLAGVAFLLPWVRLEYVAISLLVTGGLALLPNGGSLGRARSGFAVARLRLAGLPFVAAIVGIGAYFLYNGVVFGGILPVSAVAKIGLSGYSGGVSEAMNWATAVRRLVHAAGRDAVAVAELCCYVLAVWGVARLRGWNTDATSLLAVLATMLALGVENLAVQTALLYTAHTEAYPHWYYVPGYLVATLMMPVRCYVAIFLLRRIVPLRYARWRRLAVVAICAAGIAFAFEPYRFTEPFRFVHEARHSSYLSPPWGHWNGGLAGELAAFEPMLPDDAVLGSWDAGAIGYFAERPVVNLDGVVNSYDYLRADPDKWDLWLRRGGLPALGVTHLVNSARADTLGVGQFEYVGGRRWGPYSLKLWPHARNGAGSKSWRSLTSPTFGVDGRPTGYRVIRHGRLVQVFVPDCVLGGAAPTVPEMLVFAWRERTGIRREKRLWVRPHRTELGYCARTFLLPHGAETAAVISVDGTTADRLVANVRPLLRSGSGMSVYAVQNRLLYVGEPHEVGEDGESGAERLACLGRNAWSQRQDSYYFLHIHPARMRDLRYGRLAHGFLDYEGLLTRMRRSAGGRCLAEVELPPFRIRELVTGEVVQGRRIWEARVGGSGLS